MIHFPTNFITLKTERLTLKEISINDLEFFFKIRNSDKVNTFIGRKKSSLEEVKQFISDRISDFENKKGIVWVIYNIETKQNIGSVCMWNLNSENNSAEIGYEVESEFQGKGFMKEALSKVINFGFNKLNLHSIEAFTVKNNEASIKILKNFSFLQNTNFVSNEENLIQFTLTSTQL